ARRERDEADIINLRVIKKRIKRHRANNSTTSPTTKRMPKNEKKLAGRVAPWLPCLTKRKFGG
ncbi:MAG: hypothetical protein FWE95_11940, partial [Planctomycetaceae bacterium]|nr:hypothetical protein [Planctomycetaceae bacterium]